jgi:hypothetical protein
LFAGWPHLPIRQAGFRIDDAEKAHTPQKPLLRFLMAINSELPKKWSRGQQGFVVNDDWLLWELKKDKKGAQVNFAPGLNK